MASSPAAAVPPPLTLCLTAGTRREIITLSSPSSAGLTVGSLYIKAEEAFSPHHIDTLSAGFPPQPLDRQTQSQQQLSEVGIRNQDRIVVRLLAAHDVAEGPSSSPSSKKKTTKKKKKSPPKKKAATTKKQQQQQQSNSTAATASRNDDDQQEEASPSTTAAAAAATTNGSGGRKSKRAAAAAATASFAETIRQQNAILRDEKKREGNKKKKATSTSGFGGVGGGRLLASQGPSSPSSSPTKKKPTAAQQRFTASSTSTGRRLQDGVVMSRPTKRKRRTEQQQNDPNLSREEQVSMSLLGTLHDGSTAGRLMRANWKNAVNDAYEQNQAVARLAAISGALVQFRLIESPTTRDGGNNNDDDEHQPKHIERMEVTYPKGLQGRGNYMDMVDHIPRDVLQSVIKSIHPVNAEGLRPSNLALLSPRVLWSLVYHCCCHDDKDGERGTNNDEKKDDGSSSAHDKDQQKKGTARKPRSVEEALQQTAPDLDWTFLNRRKQQLSEKARENLRQQQQHDEGAAATASNDWEAAAAAIMSVEQAMEEVATFDQSQRQSRMLTAAMNRQHQQHNVNNTETALGWQLATPTDVDEDELKECIMAAAPQSEQSVDSLVQKLIKDCQVRNWRELANSNEEEAAALLGRSSSVVDAATVEVWIDKAQDESIEEIIVEICDAETAAVETLRDLMNCGTPKDLVMWRPIVSLLHESLTAKAQEKTTTTDEETPREWSIPSIDQLQVWCDRAQHALQQLEWLGDYVTPIESS